jgi:hypothetical protein
LQALAAKEEEWAVKQLALVDRVSLEESTTNQLRKTLEEREQDVQTLAATLEAAREELNDRFASLQQTRTLQGECGRMCVVGCVLSMCVVGCVWSDVCCRMCVVGCVLSMCVVDVCGRCVLSMCVSSVFLSTNI